MEAPERCEWCKDPEAPPGRKTRLCDRCNRLKLAVKKREKELEAASEWDRMNEFGPTRDLRLAQARVEIAKREGYRYGDFGEEGVTPGLTLEHELTFISRAAAGKHLYYGTASPLEREFTLQEQIRILKLLAPLGRAVMRKNMDALAAQALETEDRMRREGEEQG
jgi:hypothetical protein